VRPLFFSHPSVSPFLRRLPYATSIPSRATSLTFRVSTLVAPSCVQGEARRGNNAEAGGSLSASHKAAPLEGQRLKCNMQHAFRDQEWLGCLKDGGYGDTRELSPQRRCDARMQCPLEPWQHPMPHSAPIDVQLGTSAVGSYALMVRPRRAMLICPMRTTRSSAGSILATPP
jgi:hypothetical protein